jgi:ABC-type sugar transport system, ATPase component
MSQNEIVFEAHGINKYFSLTHANKDIDLTLRRGEIHALAGENGSGKSTLISVMCGLYTHDSGEMFINGEKYEPNSPLEASAHKVGFVVQELGLIVDLPVAINMFLGKINEYQKNGLLQNGKIYNDCVQELKKHGFTGISPRIAAGHLPVEKRKLVEFAKALSVDPDILILDETTQALSLDMRNKVYDIIQKQKEKGTAILLVTHDLEELVHLADTATVLKDGAVAGNLSGEQLTVDAVRCLMVGRECSGEYYRSDSEMSFQDSVALEVRNLTFNGSFEDVSFDLHKGEILAIGGLSDSGIHELGKVIMGVEKSSCGTVRAVDGDKLIKHPLDAVKVGMAYVPKDRDSDGLMMGTTIGANFILPSVRELAGKSKFIKPSKAKQLVYDAIQRFNVRCIGMDQAIGALSGGNKQKVSIGRWLIKDLNIIVMDCPTRGVDVSVKAYIYDLMKELKEQGMAMILIADEMTEAIGMADRMLILKNGKVAGILERNEKLNEMNVVEVMI